MELCQDDELSVQAATSRSVGPRGTGVPDSAIRRLRAGTPLCLWTQGPTIRPSTSLRPSPSPRVLVVALSSKVISM